MVEHSDVTYEQCPCTRQLNGGTPEPDLQELKSYPRPAGGGGRGVRFQGTGGRVMKNGELVNGCRAHHVVQAIHQCSTRHYTMTHACPTKCDTSGQVRERSSED